ncbi:kelch repeat-containing protein ARB_01230 [Colletotrichum liriopes]|uniref:Kelch repeat-containing protein ARB_01230 n=1 Tax=Colletotrichum liriopes TaxID=708192 RepID=A0AA37LU89_9PEZI|nr:kelch repeat-containing protein ARB_01230 [Colletotrichum liriopes]
MTQSPKDALQTQRQAYFVDTSSNTVYGWGGLVSRDSVPSQTQLGKFVANGVGGGSWGAETESSHEGLAELRRSHGGAVASTPDSGFYFGGVSEVTQAVKKDTMIAGYLQFDFKSQRKTWVNHTNARYSPSRTRYSASAHYVPTFGPNGLVMIIGGNEYDAESDEPKNVRMDTLWFLDPVTQEWYSQRTSGNPPASRRWPCTVGAQSTNGTYEIFVFGGNSDDKVLFDDIFVLSLPGFVWKRTDSRPKNGTARTFMSCVLAGQRQMITVGGRSTPQGSPGKDPFPQGLGIFDITELQWKDEYDSQAAKYDSPEIIKTWYKEGGLATVSYDAEVEAFLKSSPNAGAPGSSSDPEGSPVTAGVIAGIVVGSVSLIALVGAAAFFLRRRRNRRARGAPVPEAGGYSEPGCSLKELSAASQISELPVKQGNTELQGQDPRYYAAELDASTTLQDPRKYFMGVETPSGNLGSRG